jgi:hypothetical protein
MTCSFPWQLSRDEGDIFRKNFIMLMNVTHGYASAIKNVPNEKLLAPLNFWWSSCSYCRMGVWGVSSIRGRGIVNVSIFPWKTRDNVSVIFRLWPVIKILSATRHVRLPSCYGLILFRNPESRRVDMREQVRATRKIASFHFSSFILSKTCLVQLGNCRNKDPLITFHPSQIPIPRRSNNFLSLGWNDTAGDWM